jgi:hypothetical protein
VRTRAQLEALVKRNAEACEHATRKWCECHCGGQFHGKAHSREWVIAVCDAIEAANRAPASPYRCLMICGSSMQTRVAFYWGVAACAEAIARGHGPTLQKLEEIRAELERARIGAVLASVPDPKWVIITLSPREWNHLQTIACAFIDAPRFDELPEDLRAVALKIRRGVRSV